MPTSNNTLRSRGLPLTACEASANIATRPPSPLLSARSTSTTYFTDTMLVRVQKKIDRMP